MYMGCSMGNKMLELKTGAWLGLQKNISWALLVALMAFVPFT